MHIQFYKIRLNQLEIIKKRFINASPLFWVFYQLIDIEILMGNIVIACYVQRLFIVFDPVSPYVLTWFFYLVGFKSQWEFRVAVTGVQLNDDVLAEGSSGFGAVN